MSDPATPQPDHARRGTPLRGGVHTSERALAPDLARGLMLLLICMSNTGFYLWAAQHGPTGWHPTDGTTLDTAAQFAMITGLDLRIYPLFAFLFGYGMMQLFLRQTASGTPERTTVALLRKRSLWLIVLGFAHAGLLMAGDILGAYGVMSLILGWIFLRRSDRTLLIAAGVFLILLIALIPLAYLELRTGTVETDVMASTVGYAAGEDNVLAAAITRTVTWLFVTLGGGLLSFGFYTPMLLGFWAARRRILENPSQHLRLLGTTAVLGVAVGWVGGLPAALAHIGIWSVPAELQVESGILFNLQSATGVFGGLGYAALVGLVVYGMSTRARESLPVVAVSALGKRSLSGYLAQSVLFSPLLAAWGLGLGQYLGSATMVLFALGVWLVTVVASYLLERAGRRGPAEVLLRRLMYGRGEPVVGAEQRQVPQHQQQEHG